MNRYRSRFEQKVHQHLAHTEYESIKLDYTTPEKKHKYTPDFVDHKNKIIYESKGRLTLFDRIKMKLVRDQNPSWSFVFVLMNPNAKINKKSDTTYAQWCEQNGFKWLKL